MKKLIFLTTTLLLFACKQNYVSEAANEGPKTKPVEVVSLEKSNEPIPIQASGVLGSDTEMNLSFKTGGIIKGVYAREGQRVRKGKVIASLQTTEIDAQVLKATQGVEKAKRDVERINKLYEEEAATLEMVENLTTVLELAEADLKIAKFNQQYSRIIAPSNGRILKRLADGNELIGPGAPVFILASDGGKGFVLKVSVADRDVIHLKYNDKATIAFDAYPGREIEARVSEIAEGADPRTGSFEVELSIVNNNLVLKNGFIGKATMYPSGQAEYYKIAMDALVEGYENKANIFIPSSDGSKAEKRSVSPLYIGTDYFTISTDQLQGVSEVITSGAAYLQDGETINVVGSGDSLSTTNN